MVENERSIHFDNLIPETQYTVEVSGNIGEIQSLARRIFVETSKYCMHRKFETFFNFYASLCKEINNDRPVGVSVLSWREAAEMGPATRYTFWRNTEM